MRVWGFTVALFFGLVMWGADMLDPNTAGVDQTLIVDGDDGQVRSMEGPLWPPKP